MLVELTNYRKDGSTFLNAVMIAPVFGETGAVAFFLGTQMDVGPASGLSASRRQRAEALVRALTPRQHQVLEHMIAGYRNKQIAGLPRHRREDGEDAPRQPSGQARDRQLGRGDPDRGGGRAPAQ